MKYLDLFSGYGGFPLGIKQAYEKLCFENKKQPKGSSFGDKEGFYSKQPHYGSKGFSCVGFSEIDKYAIQVYSKHFNHKNYGDITKINPKDLPDFDLLTGGFPCQAFSIAGKRRGFEDTRGTLIFSVLRIIAEKHPKLVLLENVKGLLSHDSGNTFKTIISSLAELGYAVEWQVLNAKNFGVPQNRERVFIIGHLGGFGGRQVFPIGAINKMGVGENENEVSSTLTSCYWKGLAGGRQGLIEKTKNVSQGYRVYDPKGISTTLAGQAGGIGAKTGLYEVENCKIRKLTPIECERLMGLPDGWTAEGMRQSEEHSNMYDLVDISDTQRYKLCGNGVVVNVVEEIIKRLIKTNEKRNTSPKRDFKIFKR